MYTSNKYKIGNKWFTSTQIAGVLGISPGAALKRCNAIVRAGKSVTWKRLRDVDVRKARTQETIQTMITLRVHGGYDTAYIARLVNRSQRAVQYQVEGLS